MIKALKTKPSAFSFASNELQRDRDFIIYLLSNLDLGKDIFFYGENFKDDKEIVLLSLKHNIYAYNNASMRLQYDLNVIAQTLAKDSSRLEYMPTIFKYDKMVVKLAAQSNVSSFGYASTQLRADKDFVLELLNEGLDIARYIAPSLAEEIGEHDVHDYLQASSTSKLLQSNIPNNNLSQNKKILKL